VAAHPQARTVSGLRRPGSAQSGPELAARGTASGDEAHRPLAGHDGRPGDRTANVRQVAIDVNHLPEVAQELDDVTQRERDVLALLRDGLASREIAERLALSEATV
jgi:DNA-binding NarL/FixJ family response regulator